jgi:DNA-directed RNA polymerase beta' subunit
MTSFVKTKKSSNDLAIKQQVKNTESIRQHIQSNQLNHSSSIMIRSSNSIQNLFKSPNVVEQFMETKDVDHVEFTFMSEDEILRGSVCEIFDTKLGGPNSLYDLRMGPVTSKDTCEKCEEKWEICPGHFGHISLAVKIPHPLLYKKILEYLRLFCMECRRLVVTDERLKILGINRIKKEHRFKKVLDDVLENLDSCMHCKTKIATYSFLDDKYIKELSGKKLPVSYSEIAILFDNIREVDLIKLGIDHVKIHPCHYIISKLLVVPPCIRPPVTIDDSGQNHDDLTYKYIDILKVNKKLVESTNENVIYNLTNSLMFHVKTLFNNSKGKAKDLQGRRPIKCIKSRLSGKTGHIRKYIQGKRTNFCARTVIGPEANCMVDELVVPKQVAEGLTYPVVVNQLNITACQDLLEQDKVTCVIRDNKKILPKYACWTLGTATEHNDIILRNGKMYNLDKMQYFNPKFRLEEGDKIIRKRLIEAAPNGDNKLAGKGMFRKDVQIIDVQLPQKKPFQLQIGDTIERQLQNGDWVVLNRQPTLWKGSMRAKKIVIRPGKTFRFNLASTAAFNADRQ